MDVRPLLKSMSLRDVENIIDILDSIDDPRVVSIIKDCISGRCPIISDLLKKYIIWKDVGSSVLITKNIQSESFTISDQDSVHYRSIKNIIVKLLSDTTIDAKTIKRSIYQDTRQAIESILTRNMKVFVKSIYIFRSLVVVDIGWWLRYDDYTDIRTVQHAPMNIIMYFTDTTTDTTADDASSRISVKIGSKDFGMTNGTCIFFGSGILKVPDYSTRSTNSILIHVTLESIVDSVSRLKK